MMSSSALQKKENKNQRKEKEKKKLKSKQTKRRRNRDVKLEVIIATHMKSYYKVAGHPKSFSLRRGV